MEIRLMEEKDLDEVSAIEESIFSMPWKRKDFSDSVNHKEHLYIVAEENGEIAGYCGMWMVAGEGQINNVAVKKELRNRGIGYKMLNALLTLGKEKGLDAFTLEVRVSNTAAIHLYERLGFHSVGIRKGFYQRPAEDANIMWLVNA